jgi:hypothetical protein
MSRDDVRAELAARALAPARLLHEGRVALGMGPPATETAGAPNREPGDQFVSVIQQPQRLTVLVAGHPGRCQAK